MAIQSISKSRLGAQVSLAALAAGLAGPVAAQDVDELVVTGQRLAQEKSIAAKRDSFKVMDAVSADDIGKLPDHNTAAALRRIPGVSVQEDQGEPRFPVLRGLTSTYNRTTIDGAIVGSVDQSARTVPLDIVPSTMAARLEVVKTVTPDMDANAIGGVINVVTRSAFDAGRPFFAATAAVGDYEQAGAVRDEKLPVRANFTASTLFGPDDQFGVVLAASYQRRDSDIPQVEIASPSFREYTAAGAPVNSGAPTGNGIQVPVQRRLFWYNNIRERAGVNAKLEWRPSERLKAEVAALYTEMKDDEERSENRYEQLASAPVRDQTPTSGRFDQAANFVGLGRFQINRAIWGLRGGIDWQATDRLRWTADLIYSGAELDNPESTEDFRTPAARASEFGFTYDTSGFYPIFRPLNRRALEDPANYVFASRNELLRSSQEDVYEARTDLAFDSDALGERLELKAGAVIRSTERAFDQNSVTYTPQAGLTYTLADAYQEGPDELIAGRYRLDPRISSQGALDFFEANRARFNAAENSITSDFEVKEDVYAAYGQVTLEQGPFTLVAGLRYERTEVDAKSVRTVGSAITPVENSGSYDQWLPGVHLRWNLTDRLVVRAAWTNTIGRPNFSDITAREAISLTGTIPTLSIGNPGLKPRESEAFDLSVEAYIPNGLFAVAVFHKDIKNEIFSLTNVEMRDLGLGRGVEQVQVTRPQNAQSAKITGVEVAWQQALSFLPQPFDGFGFNVNATFLETEFTFLTSAGPRRTGFFLQPDVTSNATIYYQRGRFEGRVSYNYIGGFLETINQTIPNADQYWNGRHSYDAQVSYRITDNFTVFFEAENLTDAGRQELTGPRRNLLQEAAEYGRTYWLGLSARF